MQRILRGRHGYSKPLNFNCFSVFLGLLSISFAHLMMHNSLLAPAPSFTLQLLILSCVFLLFAPHYAPASRRSFASEDPRRRPSRLARWPAAAAPMACSGRWRWRRWRRRRRRWLAPGRQLAPRSWHAGRSGLASRGGRRRVLLSPFCCPERPAADAAASSAEAAKSPRLSLGLPA